LKQIEAFIDDIYHSVGGNRKEIEESKAEMKSHLIEAVEELKAEGKNEQEAIEIAIERFGGENEMRPIVGQLFKAQKTFAKWVLITAMAFLIICGSLLGTAISKENKMVSIENSTFNRIEKMLENNESLTPTIQEEIKSLVQNKDNIKSVKITNLRNAKEEVFEYEKQIAAPKWLYSYYNNGSSDDKWSLYMEIQRFNDFVIIGFLAGIAIYWTLFTIWATINAYHHKRLKIGWVIVFALFNVLGYLVYLLVGKKVNLNLIS
jgi:cytochrome c-type biogenesis protein CcmH/NrfF